MVFGEYQQPLASHAARRPCETRWRAMRQQPPLIAVLKTLAGIDSRRERFLETISPQRMTSRLSTNGSFDEAMSASNAAMGAASILMDVGATCAGSLLRGAAATEAEPANAAQLTNTRVTVGPQVPCRMCFFNCIPSIKPGLLRPIAILGRAQ